MTIVKSLLDNILNKNAEGTAADFIAIMNEKVSSALDTKRVEIAQSMFQKEETESLDEANYKHATIEKPGHPLHGKTGRIFYKHDDGRINVQLTNPHKRWDVTNLTLKPGEFKLKEETELQLEDFSVEELEDYMQSEDFQQLDEISGKLLGSYIQKARKQDNDKIAHGKELNADPKIVALKAKRSELYGRREYTKDGDSKHRVAIDKTYDKENQIKQKLDPNYPESVTPKRHHDIEKAIKKLQYGKMSNESVDLDEAEYAHTEFTGKIGKNWKTKGEIPTGTRSVKGHYGGGFVTDEDGNEISKPTPAVKKGRGRPKKNAGETGEKFNTDAIAALMKSKMGALPKGKSRKITGE
jgi:hypothetical protein